MRLTCPNCEAQYEVPGDVIPKEGRDVQCSNCSTTWHEAHPDHPQVKNADNLGTPVPPGAEESGAATGVTQDTPPRRKVDPSVIRILLEEAEREKRARAAARGGMETQPDLGLEGGHSAADRSREAGRTLFPDVDEINSSLSAADGPQGRSAAADSNAVSTLRPQEGFGRGFFLSVLVAVAALLLYVFAPQLADAIPALRGGLEAYAAWIDGLRQGLGGVSGSGTGTGG